MGAGHGHGSFDAGHLPVRVQRMLAAAVAVVIAAALIGMVVLWPSGDNEVPAVLGGQADLVNGTVTDGDAGPCASLGADLPLEGDPHSGFVPDDGTAGADVPPSTAPEEPVIEPDVTGTGITDGCNTVAVEVTSGPDDGQEVLLENYEGAGSVDLDTGDRIVLAALPPVDGAAPTARYQFADFQRRAPLALLALLFALAVIALSRLKGVRALLAAAISLVVIVRFVLPAIVDGGNPVAVSLVGAVAIMVVALFLSHGVNTLTTSALLGTVASLLITGVLAAVFVEATKLTGLASEEAGLLQVAASTINLQGILLGGMIIGSLGVLDDVTVTQASVVFELAHTDPELTARELFTRSLRVGRDHIASTVNTLVLAYAGASLPLLILFSQAGSGLFDALNGEIVAVEVVRTLVGSIGLVASVPLTSGLAAVLAAGPHDHDQPAVPSAA